MKLTKVVLFILGLVCFVQAAETITADHIKISWLAPSAFSRAESEMVGLRFEIDPHWHIYWKNPGDSGMAPKFNFSKGNYEVGPVQWPVPKRIPVGHLINIGYEKDVAILFNVKPKGNDKEIHLVLNLEWLVCQEECIPGMGEITLTRPIHEQQIVWPSPIRKKLDEFAARIPAGVAGSPWKITSAQKGNDQLVVRLASSPEKTDTAPELYPVEGELINPAAPHVEKTDRHISYTFTLPAGREPDGAVHFLVVDGDKSWEHEATVTTAAGAEESVMSSTDVSLFSLLFFAFLGGVILNLMPCVLPVLSIKFLSLMKASPDRRRHESLMYMAGVLTTFFTLGAVFLVLRSAGNAIGWGFQLQSPYIVLTLVLLFWLMSLNFLGFFEFGDAIMNKAGQSGRSSAFSTGILAVFVAAPCTGPFMGTALGAAATLPAISALGIFFSLGFGLAAPFVLVSFVPVLYKWIPKPGVWMEKLKQLLAFPLLGTVIWLMWVLGVQLGDNGWLIGASLLLVITLAIWLGKTFSKVWLYVGWIITVIGIAVSFSMITKASQMAAQEKKTVSATWVPYDRAVLDQARAQGQSVFVDFTAAWCITCQLNKKAVLETDGTQNVFKANNVLQMRADWTNQDPVITQALAEFGRNSVPVYLFYEKGAEAKVLPQILTIQMIEELFNKNP